MSSSSNGNSHSLTAPGRMDVVEQVLRSDAELKRLARESGRVRKKNRRGKRKRYYNLTVDLVAQLASCGLDAVTMQRQGIIREAFRLTTPKQELLEEQFA